MERERKDSRRYVRVNGFFPILWERVPSSQVEKEKELFFQKRDLIPREPWDPFSWATKSNWEIEGNPERESKLEIVLSGINIKLDLILNLLMKKEVDPIYNTSPREVNISGAGLRIRAEEKFEVGSFYKLRMLLPILPSRVVQALGRVVRVNEIVENGKRMTEGSFAFDVISEEDREIIIHYTFKRQREILREKKRD